MNELITYSRNLRKLKNTYFAVQHSLILDPRQKAKRLSIIHLEISELLNHRKKFLKLKSN